MTDEKVEAWKKTRPESFLKHASICTSQYDAQYRDMASEILHLRAALDASTQAQETLSAALVALQALASTWRQVGDNYTAIQYEHAAAAIEQALAGPDAGDPP